MNDDVLWEDLKFPKASGLDDEEIDWQDPITGRFMRVSRLAAERREEQAKYLDWLISIIKANPKAVREALGLFTDEEGYYRGKTG